MIPIVLYTTNRATAAAIRSANGMIPGLRGNDLLLESRQQPLPLSQGQPQIGDLSQIIRPGDRRDVDGLFLTVSAGFHQPHHPSHALTPIRDQTRNYRFDARTPNLQAVPSTSRADRTQATDVPAPCSPAGGSGAVDDPPAPSLPGPRSRPGDLSDDPARASDSLSLRACSGHRKSNRWRILQGVFPQPAISPNIKGDGAPPTISEERATFSRRHCTTIDNSASAQSTSDSRSILFVDRSYCEKIPLDREFA